MRAIPFAEIAPRLLDNGWPAIPINGKRPFLPGWERYATPGAISDQLLAQWCREYSHHNTGIPVPPDVVVLDWDWLDPILSQEAERIADRTLGRTPLVRFGRPPKFQRFYRGHGIGSSKLHPIEIFNGSGQVAAYGIHPDTRRPFFWIEEQPVNVTPEDLPEITGAQVAAFVAEALACVPQRRPGQPASNIDLHRQLREERANVRGHAWAVTIARQLREAQEGQLHDTLINVVAALVGAGFTDQRIREVVDAYFNAPRTGPYSAAWRQVDRAIASARKRWDRPDPSQAERAA